ncbi:MAG TPA: FG-GAP-like repeat-containing protein, partial [Gammaproteobacteria bacterium]|nr:FG-GAP-like repeat-containing protein [Gammaproteobacteria bacterium]
GSFQYTPDENFNGTDSFTYRADDGTALSNLATVTITVNAVNDPPRKKHDAPDLIVAPNAVESQPYEFDLGQFFFDEEQDDMFFAVNLGPHPNGLPESGSLRIDRDGSATGVTGLLYDAFPINFDDTHDDPRLVTLCVTDDPLLDLRPCVTDPGFDSDSASAAREVFEIRVLALDRIDLSLAISATPSPAPTGAAVDWDFAITNTHGQSQVDTVSLSAVFSGQPFTFIDTGGCTLDGTNLSCNVGPIPPNETRVVTVTGQAAQSGDVLVTGEVGAPLIGGIAQEDPNLDNNTDAVTLNVGQSFSSGPAQTITASGTLRAAAAGDIDGDGYMDLVVAGNQGTSTRIYFSVPLDPDDPNGQEFRRLSTQAVSLGDAANDGRDVLLVDLDGDGDLDLVVANGAGQANTVFLNDLVEGQANLVAVNTPLGGQSSNAVASADLDGDGLPDLVFANSSPNEIFLSQGFGMFTAAAVLGDSDDVAVAIADFDGDLLPDIVFASSNGPSLVYRNLGGGNFDEPVEVASDPAVSVRTSDFNGDGLPDLVFGHGGVATPTNAIYVNTSIPGSIRFSGPTATVGQSPTLKLVTADLSLDGITDIVSLNATGTHQIYTGTGNGTFNLHAEQFSTPSPIGAATGDFNNDGRTDIAATGPAGITVFLNDGHGNLGPGDVTRPVLQLQGASTVTLTVQNAYNDAGATATDDADGVITGSIVVDNPVDTDVIGTYTVRYTVTDRSGNDAIPVTRTVTVRASQPTGGGGGGSFGPAALVLLVLSCIFRRQYRRPSGTGTMTSCGRSIGLIGLSMLLYGKAVASELSYTFLDFKGYDQTLDVSGSQEPAVGQNVSIASDKGDGIGISGSLGMGDRFFLSGSFTSSIVDFEGIVTSPLAEVTLADTYDRVTSTFSVGYLVPIGDELDLLFALTYDSQELDFGSLAGENFDVDDSGAGASLGLRWNPARPVELYLYSRYSPVGKVSLDELAFDDDITVGAGFLWYFFEDLGFGADFESGQTDTFSLTLRFNFGTLQW